WRLCRDTRYFTGRTNSALIPKRQSSFLRKQRNSIQTSPVHLLHWHECTNGVIATSIQRPRERKKRVSQQWKRYVCSRTCPRPISQWVSITTIASVIIRERSTNSPLRS